MPDNTMPMMTGTGPYGAMEMGGMFTVVKIRKGIARNDYCGPGWYMQPKGSVAYEMTSAAPPAPQAPDARASRQASHRTER